MKKVVKNNKGFSLVELIVVIAIMAVLVGVLAPQFMGYVEKSREATDLQNLDSMRTQIEAYVADREGVTTVVLVLNSTGATAGTSASDSSYTDDALNTSKSTKLKGNRWTSLTATFNVSTNVWTYAINPDPTTTGYNAYYTLSNYDATSKTGDGIVVK
jgi:type IV pilus assembly protein PilA